MKYRKIIITALLVFVFAGMTAITVAAQPDKRAANIKSRGVFDYQHGTALMDASDLTYLANEIDLLEDTYKKETVDALNQVGTYFKPDGTTTIDPAEGTLQAEDANVLEYRTIKEALINSQAIPALPFSGERPGETDPVSGTITGATAENISLGAAAWVDGKLIIGNGGDNISYYNKGVADGYAQKIDAASISYVQHYHTGSPSAEGGCYGNGVHQHTSACHPTVYCGTYAHYTTSAGDPYWVYEGSCSYCHKSYSSAWGGSPCYQTCSCYGNCTKEINTFSLICGYKEGEVISATITF